MSTLPSVFGPGVPEFDPGDIIGYRRDGSPILHVAGGAEADFDHWMPGGVRLSRSSSG